MPRPGLSIAFAGLVEPDAPWAGGTRAKLDWAARAGFRSAQLDGTAPDCRARDLSRSARRDLSSALRRAGLGLSGIDLWIPPAHFESDATLTRALDAADQALGLARELSVLVGSPPASVSLTLGTRARIETVIELARRAEHAGSRVANYAWPIDSSPPGGSNWFGHGLDPAIALIAGDDPVASATILAPRLVAARLADSDGTTRIAPGSTRCRLDIDAYAAALDAGGFTGPLVLDLRAVADQPAATRATLERWKR